MGWEPRFRFACGTRILGTILKPPDDFSIPVLILSEAPEMELLPGQEQVLERMRIENTVERGNHQYWALKSSDFYGEPTPYDYGLKYRPVEPTGVVITPKFIGDNIFDGQMGFPAKLVRYRYDLPRYNVGARHETLYAEYLLNSVWQRYVDQPQLYTT